MLWPEADLMNRKNCKLTLNLAFDEGFQYVVQVSKKKKKEKKKKSH